MDVLFVVVGCGVMCLLLARYVERLERRLVDTRVQLWTLIELLHEHALDSGGIDPHLRLRTAIAEQFPEFNLDGGDGATRKEPHGDRPAL